MDNIINKIKTKLIHTNSFYEKYKKKIYSQWGEEGVIIEIIRILNINLDEQYICEFGAWDGKHLSNTFYFVENSNCKAIYIEGDKDKYVDLLNTCTKYTNITPINKYVSHTKKEDFLDEILSTTNIPKDFFILSIDIDSYDYHIWKTLTKYKPIIVIIEIGSGLPPPYHAIFNENGYNEGSSFQSMYELGLSKGYELVCHTGNMIFIDKKYYDKLNIELLDYRLKFCPRHVKSNENKTKLYKTYYSIVTNM